MPSLVATLKTEVRRLSAYEIQKALKPLKRIQKQVSALRLVTRSHRKTVARLERRILRLRERAGIVWGGVRVSPESIQSMRSRFGMSRAEFARLLGVSPGSVFGWETGRTVPRGRSRQRIVEVRKLGVQEARAKGKASVRRSDA